jgi:predicted anti-sigma-YlaC factor YlaD
MNDKTGNNHLPEPLIDRYVEGDLSRAEAAAAQEHLAACSGCRRTVAEYRAFVSELNALPLPAVPSGFAARILDAVLLPPSEDVLVLRWLSKAYVGLSVALATVAATVLGTSGGPGPVAGTVASGFTRTVWDGVAAGRDVVLGSVHLMETAIDLIPMAKTAGSLARGLEATAFTVAGQYSVLLTVACVLATVVLLWAVSPARERGVPHVNLSL